VVSVNPSGKTTIVVLEGQVATMARLPGGKEAETSLVSAGESQSIFKNGKATKVTKAPPGLLKSVSVRTSNPSNSLMANGLSKKVVFNKVQKLTFAALVRNAGNGKGMKAKVLKLANNIALFDAKALSKKFENIKGQNSIKFALKDSGKSNAKANAKTNAKANAMDNAKANARQVAQENGRGNGRGRP
jgi:hypothetical protein